MKNRLYFLARTISLMIGFSFLLSWSPAGKPAREFYQLTVYHYNSAEQDEY
jgi:hypothetical protein